MNDKRLDMTQLLGFSAMEGVIDMADPAVASRLGAKVGEPNTPTEPGFDTGNTGIDFRNPVAASQLGAKIGEP